jgi:Protein of unknown function (DUF559)
MPRNSQGLEVDLESRRMHGPPLPGGERSDRACAIRVRGLERNVIKAPLDHIAEIERGDGPLQKTSAQVAGLADKRGGSALAGVEESKAVTLEFRRQHPIDRYIVDFVSLDGKLVVEVDGVTHSEKTEVARISIGRVSSSRSDF